MDEKRVGRTSWNFCYRAVGWVADVLACCFLSLLEGTVNTDVVQDSTSSEMTTAHLNASKIHKYWLATTIWLRWLVVFSRWKQIQQKKNISAINPSPADVQQPPNNRPKDRCCRIEKNGRHSIEYIETLLASKMREFQLERGWELNKQGCTAAA